MFDPPELGRRYSARVLTLNEYPRQPVLKSGPLLRRRGHHWERGVGVNNYSIPGTRHGCGKPILPVICLVTN